MKRFLPVLFVLLLPLAAGAAPSRDAVIHSLAGSENPLTRASVEALGAGWEQALIELASDKTASSLYRVRALFALRFADGENAAKALRSTIERNAEVTEGAGALELKEALCSLAIVEGESATETLGAFLAHAVPDVRLVCAQALVKLGTPAARGYLARQLEREPEDFVREALSAVQ